MGRLIDENELREEILHNVEGYDSDIVNHYLDAVDSQPTAYDVDSIFKDGFEITRVNGTPIDYEALGKEHGLCYCDMEGFAITENGDLMLLDECGKWAYLDRSKYRINLKGGVSHEVN